MNVKNKKIEYIPKYRQMQKKQDMEYEKNIKKESLDKFVEKYRKLNEKLKNNYEVDRVRFNMD